MKDEVLENHKKYIERINFYKDHGYDVEQERKFILEKSVPLYGNILEVGTGKGYFTAELAKEGHSFISIDISAEDQTLARFNLAYLGLEHLVDFAIEDAEHLSFDDNNFDIIFSVNSMHHFTNPLTVIDELIRVVSFEGKIVLSDFTDQGLRVISEIHAAEGRVHAAKKSILPEVGSYLKSKGFRLQKHSGRCQDLLIAYHQII